MSTNNYKELIPGTKVKVHDDRHPIREGEYLSRGGSETGEYIVVQFLINYLTKNSSLAEARFYFPREDQDQNKFYNVKESYYVTLD